MIENNGKSDLWDPVIRPVENMFSASDTIRRLYVKDPVSQFKVKMEAGFPEDPEEPPAYTYLSEPVAPYFRLDRREFLVAREIMRKEYLMLRRMSGVPLAIFFFNMFEVAPDEATDPLTGGVIDPELESTDKYHGPYDALGAFSPAKKQKEMAEDGTGVREPYSHTLRVLGVPQLCHYDIVFDRNNGMAYHVDEVVNEAEIRRHPLVQVLTVHQVPTAESNIYRLLQP